MTPVKIVVTAQTEAAAAALQAFLANSGVQFEDFAKKARAAGHATESLFGQNRMAAMEMEHVVRSTMDGLIAGINPIRMLAMEAPRIAEAGANMSAGMLEKIKGFLPVLGLVGVALGVGAAAWHFYGDALVDPTKRAKELAEALQTIPGIVDQIETAFKAGSITGDQKQKYLDMLPGGKTPLYNQETIGDGYGGHAATTRPEGTLNAIGGAAVPVLTTNATSQITVPGSTHAGNRIDMDSFGGAEQTQAVSNQPANDADRIKYTQYQLRKDGVTDADDKTKAADKSLADLKLQMEAIQRNAETGIEKEMSRITDRYNKEREEITATQAIAQKSKGYTPEMDYDYQDALAQSEQTKNDSIAELKAKQAKDQNDKLLEAAKQQAEEVKKIQEDYLRLGKSQIDAQEEAITAEQDQQGTLRGQLAMREYVDRVALYTKLGLEGKMTEDEYAKAVQEAMKKATAGAKEYDEELKKIAQMKREATAEANNNKLAAIDRDPLLTDQQKQQASVPIWQAQLSANQAEMGRQQQIANTSQNPEEQAQAQQKYNQVLGQTQALQNQINQAQASFGQKFHETLIQLASQWENLGNDINKLFSQTLNTGIDSVASNLTKVIQGTETWRQALLRIEQAILNEVINSIIKMAIQWVLSQVMMAIAGKAIQTSAAATSAGPAAIAAAGWAVPATLATIATYGSAADAAPGFIGMAEGATLALSAFADGGRPPSGQVALVGERGPELFVPDSAGTIIPADKTQDMMSRGGSAFGGGGMGGNNVTVSTFLDKNELAKHLEKSDSHEKWVVDVMRKSAHKFT